MNNIVEGNVVSISSGSDKLSTFSRKNGQYNIAMINLYSPEQDFSNADQHRSRQTFTVELQQLHTLMPVTINFCPKALFQATSTDLASVLFDRHISQLYSKEGRQYVLTSCIANISSLPLPKTFRMLLNAP